MFFLDFNKIFQPKWLFEPVPPADFFLFWPLVIVFGSFLILALGIWIFFTFVKKELPYQQIKFLLLNLLISCGIFGLILLGIRNQNIPYLSMRFLLILLFVIFLIWLGIIIIILLTRFKKELRQYRRKQQIEKYLPRKKNE